MHHVLMIIMVCGPSAHLGPVREPVVTGYIVQAAARLPLYIYNCRAVPAVYRVQAPCLHPDHGGQEQAAKSSLGAAKHINCQSREYRLQMLPSLAAGAKKHGQQTLFKLLWLIT